MNIVALTALEERAVEENLLVGLIQQLECEDSSAALQDNAE